MSHEELATELSELWKAGQVHLPAVAADYTDAATHLRYAKNREFIALRGEMFNRTRDDWDWISADFQRILEDTAETLNECGGALKDIAQRYAHSEGVAVETLLAIAEQTETAG